jgi:homopolymeric O-antigen transport system permease protein
VTIIIKLFQLIPRYFINLGACLYQPFYAVFRNRELFIALLKRDFVNRTSGTWFGFVWLILQPALQVMALWFLIQVILQVRFPGMGSFVNYFLIGMIPWFAIAEILQRSVTLYSEFGVLFKRNPFPIVILPLLSITLTLIIYTPIYLSVVFFLEGFEFILPAMAVMFSLLMILLPVSMILSILGVFFKDIAQALPFVLTMTMYLSPILYLPDMMPEQVRAYLIFNPVADFMALIHWYLQGIEPIHQGMLLRLFIEWLILLVPAWILFKRSEKHIREVI